MEEQKICFKCGRLLPLPSFYRHPKMADGHLNKCKECTKKDVSINYSKRRPHYAEYERQRFQHPERKAAAQRHQFARRKRDPEKYKARCQTNNAIRDGKLIPQPCEFCGDTKVEAHHDDYSKPLEVRWLCRRCHLMIHGKSSYCFPETEKERAEKEHAEAVH